MAQCTITRERGGNIHTEAEKSRDKKEKRFGKTTCLVLQGIATWVQKGGKSCIFQILYPFLQLVKFIFVCLAIPTSPFEKKIFLSLQMKGKLIFLATKCAWNCCVSSPSIVYTNTVAAQINVSFGKGIDVCTYVIRRAWTQYILQPTSYHLLRDNIVFPRPALTNCNNGNWDAEVCRPSSPLSLRGEMETNHRISSLALISRTANWQQTTTNAHAWYTCFVKYHEMHSRENIFFRNIFNIFGEQTHGEG